MPGLVAHARSPSAEEAVQVHSWGGPGDCWPASLADLASSEPMKDAIQTVDSV